MITKREIMEFVKEFQLRADIIEKDYVLGWILAGIAQQTELMETLIFKGGTCIKKCFFETYRFSEDLDYTVINDKYIDEKNLIDIFKKISIWVYNESGIEIPESSICFEKYRNNAGKESIEGKIGYIGPMQRRNSTARIKFDLTADELLVSEPEYRQVHHLYSDRPETGIRAKCYNFSELFAEKIRALSERLRPRDLYDVIHIYRHAFSNTNPTKILSILEKKCEYKKIPVPTIELLNQHSKRVELELEWSHMLNHQLFMLPPYEQFWQDLPEVFEWLHNGRSKEVKDSIQINLNNIDNKWQPPSMINIWRTQSPVEFIRYAGANHLCIELIFGKYKQLVEPYDLKRTLDGQLILVSAEHETGNIGSHNLNEINKITISSAAFQPRYAINLTPFNEK